MPDADFESGLVDGLVKARKSFSSMSRRKLRNAKKPRKEAKKPQTNRLPPVHSTWGRGGEGKLYTVFEHCFITFLPPLPQHN